MYVIGYFITLSLIKQNTFTLYFITTKNIAKISINIFCVNKYLGGGGNLFYRLIIFG